MATPSRIPRANGRYRETDIELLPCFAAFAD
jgi:hypothetical protein